MPTFQKLLPLVLLFLAACTSTSVKDRYDYSNMDRPVRKAYSAVDNFLLTSIKQEYPIVINKYSKIDTIIIDRKNRRIEVNLNQAFATRPFRDEHTQLIHASLREALGRKYAKYTFTIRAGGHSIEELIPNYYRGTTRKFDHSRMPKPENRSFPLIRNLSKPHRATAGLYNRNIALWHSHGWYYEQKLERWEWQRARIFETVEDLLPMSFTVPYLIPMLENAGAQVFLPRERDVQTREIVVDNDAPITRNSYQEYSTKANPWETGSNSGFAISTPPYNAGYNPFTSGTYRTVKADTAETAKIRWLPKVSDSGKYGVYIAYHSSDSSITDAHYTIYHAGGKSEFLVNQQMGGGTWIYLGEFYFNNNPDMDIERVELTNLSRESGQIVSADGVRFGGGMGNVARNGQVSGRPRFTEGARYYLQYAGMPDTLVYSFNDEESDYKDDYQCRGEWVNYLKGTPFGPNADRDTRGLQIPIDLSFAFHTDAGVTRNDTVIGTLSIYSTADAMDSLTFPDGMSRMANRDFADILQTQIVEDIRKLYDPAWSRRPLWDKAYSEAYRPNVPSALLELLSHQNFLDMKFAMDPRFRFDASRSIYKSMVKFIAAQWQEDYVIQPLPVSHFQASFSGPEQIYLQWEPVTDPLEETATADQYILYTRYEGEAFDNGVLLNEAHTTIDSIHQGVIYSFKVTAVNPGGESFPSEILSVCQINPDDDPVLIVNGFDRVSAPATIETAKYLGFADFWDEGVPDKFDFNYIGSQYDFLAVSPWLDDDAPGHGASWGNYETTIIPGNTFDFPYVHGQAIKAAGYSFVSASDEAVMDQQLMLTDYDYVDLILGEEKEVPGPKLNSKREFRAFPKALQSEIETYCGNGGNLFISGAYVGKDLFDNHNDSLDMDFGMDVLKFRFRTDHAVKTGGVASVDSSFFPRDNTIQFNTSVHPSIYKVESPDAIEPVDTLSTTILRYSENNASAAIAHAGEAKIVVFGFPFESIVSNKSRAEVMQAVLTFFRKSH